MLQFSKKRTIIYTFLLILFSVSFYGCNKEAAADANADTQAENSDNAAADAEKALQDAVSQALNDANATPQATAATADDTATPDNQQQKAVAERSPVEITRIEVEDDPDEQASGTGEEAITTTRGDHQHAVTPNLFEIGECLVEVQGIYKVKLAKDLLKEINKRRSEYGIGSLTQNTSLLACADARCKEQTYFIGHFRPDGSAFNSIAPGFIQGECIAVDYRTVNDIMEAWFSVNKSRMQIMNPDYTQCGISIYDINGTYYIAAEFGY